MKILIAPLDWGLGHCSRCVPIINYLTKMGVEVNIAGNQEQIAYFTKELKTTPIFHSLNGYNIRYGHSKMGTFLKIILQIPRLLIAIKQEQVWLEEHLKHYNYDAIISDNRYGFRSKKVHSIFITHQINIQAPMWSTLLNKINHNYIKQFNICWIPDHEAPNQLGGALSRVNQVSFAYKYIGTLSRFEAPISCVNNNEDVLLLLSGVQPQKDIFRDLIIKPGKFHNIKFCFFGNDTTYERDNVISKTTVNTEELKVLLGTYPNIISRNGYSTLMDLCYLQRSALLVPTPGQTEQEHLATAAQAESMHVYQAQHELNLKYGLAQLKDKKHTNHNVSAQYKLVLNELIATLSKK